MAIGVVMLEEILIVTFTGTRVEEPMFDDVVGSCDTVLLAPLPYEVLIELLNVSPLVGIAKILPVVVEFKDAALDVELVILLDVDALAELNALEVTGLIEVVLLTELVRTLEMVAVIGKSVTVDLDEDEDEDKDELVRLLDFEEVVTEEVLAPDFLELEDVLVVLCFLELVDEVFVLVVPSIQSQSSRSWGALKALKGDEVLVLFLI